MVNLNLNASNLDYFSKLNIVCEENLEMQFENLFKTFDVLKEYGIDINDHPEILDVVLPVLAENEIHILDKDFQELKIYILDRFNKLNNPNLKPCRSPRLPSQKQPEYSKGFLSGFVQVLAGSILCIIPHPVSIAIGSSLIVSGIHSFVTDAMENKTKTLNEINNEYEFPIIGKSFIPYRKKNK